jgi:hypothetical protein
MSVGGRARYLYAPELLTVFSSFQPPTLGIARQAASQTRVDVNGIPGQRIVLQSTTDFTTWQPLATNWLETSRWSYITDPGGSVQQFFRAGVW